MYLDGREISEFQYAMTWDGVGPTKDGFLIRGTHHFNITQLVGQTSDKSPYAEPDINRAIDRLVMRLAIQVLCSAAAHLSRYSPDLQHAQEVDGMKCQLAKQTTSGGTSLTVTILGNDAPSPDLDSQTGLERHGQPVTYRELIGDLERVGWFGTERQARKLAEDAVETEKLGLTAQP